MAHELAKIMRLPRCDSPTAPALGCRAVVARQPFSFFATLLILKNRLGLYIIVLPQESITERGKQDVQTFPNIGQNWIVGRIGSN